ncbi:MAG: thioredoxin domain-containing protein [Polyangiaceae bacterium]
MRNAEGGFFATQDADSEGHEGKFFVWSKKEIEEVLGASRDSEIACDHFGVEDDGNFEDSDHSVLSLVKTDDELAKDYELPIAEIRQVLETAQNKLLYAREKRVKPFRDEKIMTSWNGLMIAAMAHAGAALDAHELTLAAEKAFAFLESKLMKRDAGAVALQRHVLGDAVKGPAFLDDYAFVADAALELYEATSKPAYAIWARDIAGTMLAKFWSEEESKFYFSGKDGEALIVRPVDLFDHAIPSATSMACRVLLRLGSLMHVKYMDLGRRALGQVATAAIENPFGFGQTLCELDRLVNGSTDVVIVTGGGDASALLQTAHATYLPNRTIALVEPNAESLEACALLAEGKPAKTEPVAYVCRNQTCSAPVASAEDLETLLAAR